MFSRIFSGDDNVSEKKKKQIDTLKVFNDNVTVIQAGEEYRVDFSPATGSEVSLQVTLPEKFPLEKPVLKVQPAISHPWVDSASGEITKAPGLTTFSIHSDLGRVVQAIIRELTRQISAASSPQATSNSPPIVQEMETEQTLLQCALSKLTISQLEELDNNEDMCDEFLEHLPPLRTLDAEIERLSIENELLAKDAVAQEPLLNRLRQDVEEKATHVECLRNQYEELSHEYQQVSDRYTPLCIKEALREAAASSDQQSERLAEQFLAGEMDADFFLESYINKRMLSHGRRVKEEKLHRQLQELERAGY